MRNYKVIFFSIITVVPLLISFTTFAYRGCCSWHHGVAYCDTNTGRFVCRDGTYSPTCTCEMNNKQVMAQNIWNNTKNKYLQKPVCKTGVFNKLCQF